MLLHISNPGFMGVTANYWRMCSCSFAGCDATLQYCAIGFPGTHRTEPCAGRFCRNEGATGEGAVGGYISYTFITLLMFWVGYCRGHYFISRTMCSSITHRRQGSVRTG